METHPIHLKRALAITILCATLGISSIAFGGPAADIAVVATVSSHPTVTDSPTAPYFLYGYLTILPNSAGASGCFQLRTAARNFDKSCSTNLKTSGALPPAASATALYLYDPTPTLAPATTYFYRVRGIDNGTGLEYYGNELSFTTPSIPPPPPPAEVIQTPTTRTTTTTPPAPADTPTPTTQSIQAPAVITTTPTAPSAPTSAPSAPAPAQNQTVAPAPSAPAVTEITQPQQAAPQPPAKTLPTTAVRINNTIAPLYGSGDTARAFIKLGDTITSYLQDRTTAWSKNFGMGTLFGGFDYNVDGITDFALEKQGASQTPCLGKTGTNSWIDIYSGKTGDRIGDLSPLNDICWTQFGYSTRQWAYNTLAFGETPGILAAAPQYATQGWMFKRDAAGNKNVYPYLFPSTPSFDALYTADKPGAQQGIKLTPSQSYTENSHVQNGLVTNFQGVERLVLFTSARVLQYRVGAYNSTQLIADAPFVARQDIGGRNYGLVSVAANNNSKVALIAGTHANTVATDMKNNSITADPYGSIERHVSIYDLASNTVDQRFFSYAHDNNDGDKYQNRIVYPGHAVLPSMGGANHLVYSVFANKQWTTHISHAGSTGDAAVINKLFVWDVRDLDNDGTFEVIASPTGSIDTPGFGAYLPDWKTEIYQWNPSTKALTKIKDIPNAIPYLTASFNETRARTSGDALYTVATGIEDKKTGLYTVNKAGTIALSEI